MKIFLIGRFSVGKSSLFNKIANTGAGKAELFGDGIYYIEDDNVSVKRQLWKPPLFENN